MQPCDYAKKGFIQCDLCEIPFHNQCKKFLQVHARWLARKLLKNKAEAFKFTPIKNVEYYSVVYSRKADIAKSVALQFALQKNDEIVPYTSSVAMDMVTRKMEIDANVVYLHVKKAVGDKDSIVGMIESFCDWVEKDGGKVSVFLDDCAAYTLKYKCVEELDGSTTKIDDAKKKKHTSKASTKGSSDNKTITKNGSVTTTKLNKNY